LIRQQGAHRRVDRVEWIGCVASEAVSDMGATGLEPVKDSSRNTHVSLLSGAECGAYLNDADLSAVVNAWAKLPSALKAGIVAMVKAAGDA
jgi:hypothetical protein